MSTLATSQQAATALVNALQHVNREKESVVDNERVQTYLGRVKTERKKVVRYIQLVKDEEYLGGLISANDQIILSLELYDKLSKTADVDSDDDEPLANIKGGKSAAERAHDRAEAEEAEIALVQKRLAAAHLGESELEALQGNQRYRIQRHNSHRSQSIRSGQSGITGDGHMRDLMDLNFDDQASSHPSQSTSAARSSTQGGTLSDYSDYESESEEDTTNRRGGGDTGADRWSQQEEDGENFAPIAKSIGPDSLLQDDDDDGDDPFADPHDALENFAPLRASEPRQTYAAV